MGQPSPGSTTDKLAPSSSSISSGKWQLEELENVAAAEENKKGKNDLMGCCSMFERINDVDEFCYQTDKIAFCIFSFVFCLYNLAYTIVYST